MENLSKAEVVLLRSMRLLLEKTKHDYILYETGYEHQEDKCRQCNQMKEINTLLSGQPMEF